MGGTALSCFGHGSTCSTIATLWSVRVWIGVFFVYTSDLVDPWNDGEPEPLAIETVDDL